MRVDLEISDLKLTIYDKDEAFQLLERRWVQGEKTFVITLNSEMIAEAKRNESFRQALKAANIMIPDSVGISLACKILNGVSIRRYPGIEFALDVLKWAKGSRVFLLGAKESSVSKAREKLASRFPSVEFVGHQDGYFSEEEVPSIIDRINQLEPDILLVGMGSPKQELWIHQYLKELSTVKLAVGVGGSFDVFSGTVRRAPKLISDLGLEWLYRAVRQPKRVLRWGKLIAFMFTVLGEKLRHIR